MIKLMDLLKEYEINKPGKSEIPSGWEQLKVDTDQDPEEDIEIEAYSAPMEGWDYNHEDIVTIKKTPDFDPLTRQPLKSEYYVVYNLAFGDYVEDEKRFNSLTKARKHAILIMVDIKETWKNEDDEMELDEYEVKKPAAFNTDPSKGKLYVNLPLFNRLQPGELSLLRDVYTLLKPLENKLNDRLKLDPHGDRIIMSYGYYEYIPDREIFDVLDKHFDVIMDSDFDDDTGQSTYYVITRK